MSSRERNRRPSADLIGHLHTTRATEREQQASTEGFDETLWVEVIRRMDEVYAQLLEEEVKLEEKNDQLEQSQRFTNSVMASMSDVLIAIDTAGLIDDVNPAMGRLLSRAHLELKSRSLFGLLADDVSAERVRGILRASSAPLAGGVELNLLDASGESVSIDTTCTERRDAGGRRAGFVIVGRPLGELRRAYRQLQRTHAELQRTQQQLLHSEKMASLGRLVAGVAHELNNPISFIVGNMPALQRYARRLSSYVESVHAGVSADEQAALRDELRIDRILADIDPLIEGTIEGARRTAEIVDGLRRFSAIDRDEDLPLDLNAIVDRAIHWVSKASSPATRIVWRPSREVIVRGSAGQLLQVFMNLIQNAHDAMLQSADATLEIREHVDRARVVLEFCDNGPGIDAQSLPHLFEPFFTTKEIGRGTGLGLSISYGIVERHGGSLLARNNPQRGACFIVSLPLQDAGATR